MLLCSDANRLNMAVRQPFMNLDRPGNVLNSCLHDSHYGGGGGHWVRIKFRGQYWG